ncbi:DUF883 family protein [Quisquiliibacterium transsilvanicum]|uniref:ElaB/YqjD/DUF883 family membrane-anchored ribosome-binding protein n=1 Tax=Quisquiliibacterium transsilvanicum TaxID=1549638 RepID=A0A7W8M956_9BURK|nr:DUF883 family protein [Quisquiliibacterium transsilvanicum]MBB5272503.1 ElaB/YqjD/DUF883 family membrane-anchored ribosome-binding protein [Quisquiliibacterium transsilvanicum]
MDENTINKDQILADMRVVVGDLESMLKATANSADADVRALSERLRDRLSVAKSRLLDAEHAMLERGRQLARTTDDYVHQHPWSAIGAAAGIGLLLGVVISRR